MSRTNCPENYDQAWRMLGGRDQRKIGNNTYLHRRACEAFAVRLHATDVVTFYKDGIAELNSGGYFTVTTKDRWRNCGFNVYSLPPDGVVSWYGKEYGYADGIKLIPGGNVQGDDPEVFARHKQLTAEQRKENYEARQRNGLEIVTIADWEIGVDPTKHGTVRAWHLHENTERKWHWLPSHIKHRTRNWKCPHCEAVTPEGMRMMAMLQVAPRLR